MPSLATPVAPATSRSTGGARRPPIDRYVIVTAVATPSSLGLYAAVLTSTDWSPSTANVLVATAVAVPSFVACKRWVWASRSKVSFRGEVLPYWLSTVVNVVLATLAVDALAATDPPRWLLAVIPTAVYTVTWIVRFLLLDRFVFRRRAPASRHHNA